MIIRFHECSVLELYIRRDSKLDQEKKLSNLGPDGNSLLAKVRSGPSFFDQFPTLCPFVATECKPRACLDLSFPVSFTTGYDTKPSLKVARVKKDKLFLHRNQRV